MALFLLAGDLLKNKIVIYQCVKDFYAWPEVHFSTIFSSRGFPEYS